MCIVGNWWEMVRMPVTRMMYITYNTPYVTLVRCCNLQMKHIPLGMGNLIVQEFK